MIPTVLFGEPNPVAGWQKYFGENSEPLDNANAYPGFAEVRAKYLELRSQTLKILDSLAEEDLDKPTKAPPRGREHEFSTFGQSFLALSLHQMLH